MVPEPGRELRFISQDDFFRKVIERRKTLSGIGEAEKRRLDRFLKILANSGSYGIFAEVNREQVGSKKKSVRVIGPLRTFEHKVERPEEPGPFFFPPFAALTTSAARLMLALLERVVTDFGGSYAFCDTDSMAIVASEVGGLLPCPGGPEVDEEGRESVRALTWEQVWEIVGRFEALNPYNLSGSILEVEENQNFVEGDQIQIHAFVISAKRYVLFRVLPDGGIDFVKDPSEHGLGHLRDPLGD